MELSQQRQIVRNASVPTRRLLPTSFRSSAPGVHWGLAIALILLCGAEARSEPSYQAGVLYERGAHALRGGDISGSLVFLEQAVALSPDFVEALSLYGRVLLAVGENEKASEILERVARLSPGGDQNFYLGIASYRVQDWEGAVRFLEAAKPENSGSGQLFLYLGIAQQELGNLPEAREALERAGQLDPTLQGPIEYRLGLIELENSVEDARKHFDRVQQVAPDSDLARSATEYVEHIDSGYFRSWGVAASLGGGYDSNVSLVGETPTIKGIDSGVGTAEVNGRATLFDHDALVIDAGGGGYIEYHGGAPANLFDQVLAQAWMSSTTPVTTELELTLSYNFQYVWANYSPFRMTNAGEARFRYNPKGKRTATQLYYRAEGRDYMLDFGRLFTDPTAAESALNRDGVVQRVGLEEYVYLDDWWGWGKSYALFGFRYRWEGSEGTEFDSDGYRIGATFGLPLPLRTLWTTTFNYEWRLFDNPSCYQTTFVCGPIPPGEPDRSDRIIELVTEFQMPVMSRVTAALRYRFWHRNSNYAFYQYDRNLVEVSATYLY